MKIKEITPGTKNINITATITDKKEPIERQRADGTTFKVCSATITDETGETHISLFDNKIDELQIGDKIEIRSGFAKQISEDFTEITTGKFGQIIKLSGTTQPPKTETKNNKAKEKIAEIKKKLNPSNLKENIFLQHLKEIEKLL